MLQHQLGSVGPTVSELGLGTMTFGAETDEVAAHAMLDRFVGAGGTFVDTADVYAGGTSEEIVGSWLSKRGGTDGVVIATKARFSTSEHPADSGAGRAHLRRALEASLRRLGIETIDLYQLHAWDPATPIEETMETFDEFVRSGRVKAVGVSNFLGWQLERAVLAAEQRGWAPLVSLQPQYNLLSRDIELDALPVCLQRDLGVLPWSPLAGGWLTGKYRADQRPSGATRLGEDPQRGVEAYDLRNTDRTWRILAAVEELAKARGVSMGQVALNWVRQRPGVCSVLLGCRTISQLEDNLASAEWQLTADEMASLTEISAPGIPIYPHGFLEVEAGMDDWERLGTRRERPYGPPEERPG